MKGVNFMEKPVFMLAVVFTIAIVYAIVARVRYSKLQKEKLKEYTEEAEAVGFEKTTAVKNYIWFDENRQKWAIPTKLPYYLNKYAVIKETKVYDYGDIVNYELLQNGNVVTRGELSVSGALVGGALYGRLGSMIGGLNGKSVSRATCTVMKIKITVNDTVAPIVYIDLINSETTRDSAIYVAACDSAQKILSMLAIITRENAPVVVERKRRKTTTSSSSAIDDLKKLKELLDMGGITEEEYNQKKKELLNL